MENLMALLMVTQIIAITGLMALVAADLKRRKKVNENGILYNNNAPVSNSDNVTIGNDLHINADKKRETVKKSGKRGNKKRHGR